MKKDKSLFSELKRELNGTFGDEFKISTIIKHIGDIEDKTSWKLSNNNPHYRIRCYISYFYRIKLLERRERGIYSLNHGIPDWLTVTGLEFLVGYGKKLYKGMTKDEFYDKVFNVDACKKPHPLIGTSKTIEKEKFIRMIDWDGKIFINNKVYEVIDGYITGENGNGYHLDNIGDNCYEFVKEIDPLIGRIVLIIDRCTGREVVKKITNIIDECDGGCTVFFDDGPNQFNYFNKNEFKSIFLDGVLGSIHEGEVDIICYPSSTTLKPGDVFYNGIKQKVFPKAEQTVIKSITEVEYNRLLEIEKRYNDIVNITNSN